MTRRIDPEERALRILRRLADAGDADAAAQLALAERRRKRDATTQARREAEVKQKNATKVSRSETVIGPIQPEGYAERMLAWLKSYDPSPDLTAQVDAEFRAWGSAADDFNTKEAA
jgi:hypothetical protein